MNRLRQRNPAISLQRRREAPVRGAGARKRLAAALLLAVAIMFAPSPASAQSTVRKPPLQKLPARERAAQMREVRTLMNKAVILLRTDPDQSIRQMKRLLADYPQERQFIYEKLGYAYAFAGKPDSAITAYETCVKIDPIRLSAARELAQIYINHGREEEAEALFTKMLERSPNRLQGYRAVSQAQSGAGWHAQALETFRRARNEFANPTLFALEMGDLEKLAGNMEAALREYLLYARSQQPNINTAQDKIYELLQNPKTDSERALAILEEQGGEGDLQYRQRVLAVLSHIFFQERLFEKALNAALESDRITATNGRPLYTLIQRMCGQYEAAAERKDATLLDLCLRASDAYLLRHPRSPEAPAVHLARATMLAERSSTISPALTRSERDEAIDSAIGSLDHVITHYPGSKFAERAALLKGDLWGAHGDREAALQIYRTAMAQSKEYRGEFAERIARTLLALGSYDAGREHCARLIGSRNKQLVEIGYYYTGLTFAWMGEHETARDTLTAFAERMPASPYTNDAIDLAWAIEMGIRFDAGMLEKYIAVLRAELAGDSAVALGILEEFAAREPGTTLRPQALFRLGALRAGRGEHQQALEAYSLFLDNYPEHALAPEIERHIGRVYELGLGNEEEALKRYEHVLMIYPAYVFLDEVRREVVRLRSRLEPESVEEE